MKILLILFFSIVSVFPQLKVSDYYTSDESFTESVNKIIKDLKLDGSFEVGEDGMEEISFAVIDMNNEKPVIAGFNMENFIYPASVYKMYVAMEVLNQISEGKYKLDQQFIVKTHNAVDKSKEIKSDPRPLLQMNDTVTINYLLDLMITRSDNSAANCLIDIAGRENINKTIKELGWEGSEVTRKFLSRKFEDPGYDTIRGTETCALHAADFMYKMETNTLINFWVSSQLKALLCRQLDKTKLAQGFPGNVMYCHKTGWWSYWTNDVGYVSDDKVNFVIACFFPIEEEKASPLFKEIAARVYNIMKERNQ